MSDRENVARLITLKVKRSIEEFLSKHPEYVVSALNRCLVADWLTVHNIVVPNLEILENALAELHSELELSPEPSVVRIIDLTGTGPTVRQSTNDI
jgi:hypothetical protein